jgi:hypothetical protein
VVDGVLRKSVSSAAKTVHHQKHKKLDIETFLYKSGQESLDTDMLVGSLSGITTIQGEGKETIGTMELRLYITRHIGVDHVSDKFDNYTCVSDNVEDDGPRDATYKMVAPNFQMKFEKNAAALDKPKLNRQLKMMNAKRPGTEPWAIFRFHYRSKGSCLLLPSKDVTNNTIEAITENWLNQTYDPLSKDKIEPHTLDLEPVPPLPEGTKPQKDDGDSSTRASSPPATPDVPSTPVKAALKGANGKVRTILTLPRDFDIPMSPRLLARFVYMLLPLANSTS